MLLVNVSGFRNIHYEVPHNVSSVYTGREDISQRLREICLPSKRREIRGMQKRFVLFGLGGSGKTQVCLKFAQDHREKYVCLVLDSPELARVA